MTLALVVLSLAAGALPAAAQEGMPDITEPLPRVNARPWREIERDQFTVVYEQKLPSPVSVEHAVNGLIHLRVYVPQRPNPVPPVIITHYWGATDLRLENELAEKLAARGMAAVIMTLPYHLERNPEGYRSGELAIRDKPQEMVDFITQATLDIKRTVDWIETKSEFDASSIGLSGTSLGAMVSSLAYAVEPRIKSASFLLGGADFAEVLWSSSRVVQQRRKLRKNGWTKEKVAEVLAPVEPLNFLKQDGRQTFVVRAKYDTVVPPVAAEKLIAALGDPHQLVLETGHYGGALVYSKLLRTTARFFDAALRDVSFTAPDTFYSPTIRLGLQMNGDSGLQFAAGLDVWRAGDKGFAAMMLTPRGAQAFIGHKINDQYSLGASVTRKRITWGLFWGIVL
jgi:dienelactone hydrolase